MNIRKLLVSSLISLSLVGCAHTAKSTEKPPIINPTAYEEICERSHIMFEALKLSGMKPIFISGDSSGVAMVLYVNLKTEQSSILRVNNGVGCIVGHGIRIILKYPEGLQKI